MSDYTEAFNLQNDENMSADNKKKNGPIVIENDEIIPNHTTIHSQPFGNPKNVVQDNNVDFPVSNSHSWSNTRGYGNINLDTHDNLNNIHSRSHPYNRIPPIIKPYDVDVDTNMAWDLNQVKLDRNCNK